MNELEKEIEKFTKLSYESVCKSISDEWIDMGGGRYVEGGYESGAEELDLRIEGGRFRGHMFRYSVYLSDPMKPDFKSVDNGVSLDLYRDLYIPKHLVQFKTDELLWIDLIDLYNNGVIDILNLQPHEYGILKLKYGVDRECIFIPKVFHKIVKALYKELGFI